MIKPAYLTKKIDSMLILLSLFLFINTQPALSGVFDHLAKAEGKGNNHSMRNIDFIYIINLDHRPEKFKLCTDQLHPYGIYPYRFSAIYGKKLSLDVINDIGVKCEPWMDKSIMASYFFKDENGVIRNQHEKFQQDGRTYFCHCLGLGPIAIVLSHLSVLKDAYDSGYQTVWIMEDDIQVIRDPHLLSSTIEKLDHVTRRKWDILFTDQDTKNQKGEYVPCLGYAKRPDFSPKNPSRFAKRRRISNDFRRVGARYGAYSFIIRRSGMKKILDFYRSHNIFLPYDMENYFPHDITLVTVTDDIISTIPNALSDNN